MSVGHWRTVAGDIDVLLGLSDEFGLLLYDTVRARAVLRRIGETDVYIGCLEHMILSKRYANRVSRHRDGLAELERLLARRGQ
jgi:hypothetical protein